MIAFIEIEGNTLSNVFCSFTEHVPFVRWLASFEFPRIGVQSSYSVAAKIYVME